MRVRELMLAGSAERPGALAPLQPCRDGDALRAGPYEEGAVSDDCAPLASFLEEESSAAGPGAMGEMRWQTLWSRAQFGVLVVGLAALVFVAAASAAARPYHEEALAQAKHDAMRISMEEVKHHAGVSGLGRQAKAFMPAGEGVAKEARAGGVVAAVLRGAARGGSASTQPDEACCDPKDIEASSLTNVAGWVGGLISSSSSTPPPTPAAASASDTASAAGDNSSLVRVSASPASPSSQATATLFCWVMVLAGSVEPWLVAVQMRRNTGVFGCNAYSVFSDDEVDMGRGPGGEWFKPVVLRGPKAWKGPVPGSSEEAWHNTVVFERAWKRIYQDGLYSTADWSVKVDPDTAFLPGILQKQIVERYNSTEFMKKLDPTMPTYLLNCKQWYSFQGPLEILSASAADKFFGGIDECKAGLSWNDWGEDWFVEHCVNFLGLQKREGFGLLDDMYCESEYRGKGHTYLQEFLDNGPTCNDGRPAYHPYKTVSDMSRCLEQAATVRRA